MRGGVDAHNLLYEADLSDLSILDKIVTENIELSKKLKQPIL